MVNLFKKLNTFPSLILNYSITISMLFILFNTHLFIFYLLKTRKKDNKNTKIISLKFNWSFVEWEGRFVIDRPFKRFEMRLVIAPENDENSELLLRPLSWSLLNAAIWLVLIEFTVDAGIKLNAAELIAEIWESPIDFKLSVEIPAIQI